MSDLEQIVNGVEPEQAETPEQEPVVEAAPEETPEPQAEPEPKQEPQMVPVGVVQELRQELRELKALATPRAEPVPAPDVFEDQAGFTDHIGQQVNQQVMKVKLDISEEMTRAANGDEKVDAALAAFQAKQDPALYQSVMGSRNPWGEMVKWHDAQQIADEIGNDPAGYRLKVEAEVRAKLEAEMVAKQATAAAAKLAPSMANVTGTGGGPRTTWTGPAPLTSVIPE